MKRFSQHRPSPAFVISMIALIVALGGTAYASTVANNSVGTKQLKSNAVTTKKIKNGAVTTKKLKNGAVTASKINTSGLSVPHASTADSATHASTADTATHASTADTATNADNATAAKTAGTVFEQIASTSTSLPTTGSGQFTVLTEAVPAGTYLVIGTGTLNNNSASTARRICETSAGTDSSDQLVGTDSNPTNDDTTPWTNTLVHTFTSAGTITLSCAIGSEAFDVEHARIEAVQVKSIVSATS